MRLLPKPQVLGTGYHRSGWPLAHSVLREIATDDGILLDDFVEQTWIYNRRTEPIAEPWIGVFHHPPNPPAWSRLGDRLDQLPANRPFRRSLANCRMAICLSDHLAKWVAHRWQLPTAVVNHPTGFDGRSFDVKSFRCRPRLLQCGWYMRNTRLIDQIETPIPRLRLSPSHPAWQRHDDDCRQFFRSRPGYRPETVTDLGYVDAADYDTLLASCVVVQEVLDASANNVTLECIARNTPLIVNRHPAVVEYLGSQYPLFYDDYTEIGDILTDLPRVQAAHEYLQEMAKTRFTADSFRVQISNAVRRLGLDPASSIAGSRPSLLGSTRT